MSKEVMIMSKEEALKRLNELRYGLFLEDDELAIEYLLEENKRLEEINKQHQELNGKLREEKENLIKYLEEQMKEIDNLLIFTEDEDVKEILLTRYSVFKEILERVKEGKYD